MDKGRVLIVEDEAMISLVVRRMLEAMGYSVVAEVRSGEDAVDVASQLRPDLVLMDIRLNGEMDGISAAGQIRDQFAIPMVFVTAHADGDTLKRAEVTQPSGYLIKPFGSASLQAVVERAIQYRSYCYAVDVNEHRMSDDLWRQLALVEERNRMSRDLHDTVEHSLIGIMLRMDTVRELMDSDPLAAIAELESTRALAKTGLEQVGRAVWDLQPLSIATNPLRDVISRGLSRLRDEGIKTSLEMDREEPRDIDQRHKLAVIRIVQEALSNIRLHSRASTAKIRLSYTRTHIMLLITDDGVGFDPSTTHSALSPTSRGIGLANMRESARLAGGSFDVCSAPEAGTQVEVYVPLEHDAEQDRVLFGRPPDEEPSTITNREMEVLQILANGGRNKDIAAEMIVSSRTVKFHIENLYKKLDVRTRAELIRVATQRGLLTV